MKFLKKLFAKNKQPQAPQPQNQIQALVAQFGGVAFEKQFDLDSVIDGKPWQIDIENQQIIFGDDVSFSIQILGTFSDSSDTWLWAWANDKSGLDESIIQKALELKKYGEEHDIDLFKHSQSNGTDVDLHTIGLIACSMFNANGYYVANHDQGAVVLTIIDEHLAQINQANSTHQRILTVFPQFISFFEMNHHAALIDQFI